jgi:hypothetical protein
VNGNIEAEWYGVNANGGSTTVAVNGNVTSKNGGNTSLGNYGVLAQSGATVSVAGNVYDSLYGAVANYASSISISGNVTDVYVGAHTNSGSSIFIDGDVEAKWYGVFANNGTVSVGNAYGATYGVVATDAETTVTVNGNLVSDDGGVFCRNGATVFVNGTISANPENYIIFKDYISNINIQAAEDEYIGICGIGGVEYYEYIGGDPESKVYTMVPLPEPPPVDEPEDDGHDDGGHDDEPADGGNDAAAGASFPWPLIILMALWPLILLFAALFWRIAGVVACNGKPIGGVSVQYRVDGKEIRTIVSDCNGRFAIYAARGSEVELLSIGIEGSETVELMKNGRLLREKLPLSVCAWKRLMRIDIIIER